MKNRTIIPTILFIIILIFSFIAFSQEKSKNQPEMIEITNQISEQGQIILFYSDNCPHCKIVEDYLKQYQIDKKISFAQKEVYYNQNNTKELEIKAKICGLPTDSIGVPFLWDGKKCLIGDQNIIDFFKQKTNGR